MLTEFILIKLQMMFEIIVVTLTIFGEGQSEGYKGRILIGNVIQNRCEIRNTSSINICLANKQFSYWNSIYYLNRDINQIIKELNISNFRSLKVLIHSYKVANKVVNKKLNHLKNNVLFYTRLDINNKWTKEAKIICIHRHHKFMML